MCRKKFKVVEVDVEVAGREGLDLRYVADIRKAENIDGAN